LLTERYGHIKAKLYKNTILLSPAFWGMLKNLWGDNITLFLYLCHSRGGGNPVFPSTTWEQEKDWTPAFAGVTEENEGEKKEVGMTKYSLL